MLLTPQQKEKHIPPLEKMQPCRGHGLAKEILRAFVPTNLLGQASLCDTPIAQSYQVALSVGSMNSVTLRFCLAVDKASRCGHLTVCNYIYKNILPILFSQFHEFVHVCVLHFQSCWTLCDPMDCGPPDSSVHGIFQARILEWVAMPSSKVSS